MNKNRRRKFVIDEPQISDVICENLEQIVEDSIASNNEDNQTEMIHTSFVKESEGET